MIVAAGRLRNPRALAPILRLAGQLTSKSEFSHYRAVSQVLGWIADAAAAPVLAKLLTHPDVRGHVESTVEAARKRSGPSPKDEITRSLSLREVGLARALYRCGDRDGLGARPGRVQPKTSAGI